MGCNQSTQIKQPRKFPNKKSVQNSPQSLEKQDKPKNLIKKVKQPINNLSKESIKEQNLFSLSQQCQILNKTVQKNQNVLSKISQKPSSLPMFQSIVLSEEQIRISHAQQQESDLPQLPVNSIRKNYKNTSLLRSTTKDITIPAEMKICEERSEDMIESETHQINFDEMMKQEVSKMQELQNVQNQKNQVQLKNNSRVDQSNFMPPLMEETIKKNQQNLPKIKNILKTKLSKQVQNQEQHYELNKNSLDKGQGKNFIQRKVNIKTSYSKPQVNRVVNSYESLKQSRQLQNKQSTVSHMIPQISSPSFKPKPKSSISQLNPILKSKSLSKTPFMSFNNKLSGKKEDMQYLEKYSKASKQSKSIILLKGPQQNTEEDDIFGNLNMQSKNTTAANNSKNQKIKEVYELDMNLKNKAKC